MTKNNFHQIKERFLTKFAIFQKHPSFYALCFWLVSLFVVLLIADLILMPFVAGRYSFTSVVPNLSGKSPKEASAILDQENLKVLVDSVSRFSPTIPAGAVLYQSPVAGRRVKEGRTVHLTLSSGPRSMAIPDLRGKSLAQAKISLHRLELLEGKISQIANKQVPRGVVIRTQPKAGTPSHQGMRVDIFVSGGSASGKQHLPDMSGLEFERASFLIDSLNFKIGKVTRKATAGKSPGAVLEQRPRPGEFLDPGTEINLIIVD